MIRTGAEGSPPPPHRRRSIFRVDPPAAALPDTAPSVTAPSVTAPSARPDERPRPVPALGPRSVRPPTVRGRCSIFRSDAEHDGASR